VFVLGAPEFLHALDFHAFFPCLKVWLLGKTWAGRGCCCQSDFSPLVEVIIRPSEYSSGIKRAFATRLLRVKLLWLHFADKSRVKRSAGLSDKPDKT